VDLDNETRVLVAHILFWGVITVPLVMFVTIRVWAEISLAKRMKSLHQSGHTRREVRAEIKLMKPLPWDLRLLLWLKYRNTDSYYQENFLKDFSRRKLGTAPEPITDI
jgi:hypothetical protein